MGGMNRREDLSVDAALDLTEGVEPYVEAEDAYKALPQAMMGACIPQHTLVVSMMVSAAVSALAVVVLVRPSAPAALARPQIEVSLPRAQPSHLPPAPTVTPPRAAPAPVVTQLPAARAPRPAPVARAHTHKKRTLTARVSRREWSRGFAD